jgi:D-glycero-D-manno-heptose 1,7-bisphosphate phosphatase
MSHSAVFLDRDGTINHEVNYLSDVAQFALIDGVARGVQMLNQAGLKVIVITNQAGVARGYLTEQKLECIHRAMREELQALQATIDAVYYCPHHPSEGLPPYLRECDCRKPSPGLLTRAAADWDLDLSRSFMVGDKLSDLRAGHQAGCATILVRTGYGSDVEKTLASQSLQPRFIAANLLEASEWILTQQPHP